MELGEQGEWDKYDRVVRLNHDTRSWVADKDTWKTVDLVRTDVGEPCKPQSTFGKGKMG